MNDFYNFNMPDKKARVIRSDETFTTEIILTPDMREKIRAQADQSCVICLGEGLHFDAGGKFKMCSCLEIA